MLAATFPGMIDETGEEFVSLATALLWEASHRRLALGGQGGSKLGGQCRYAGSSAQARTPGAGRAGPMFPFSASSSLAS